MSTSFHLRPVHAPHEPAWSLDSVLEFLSSSQFMVSRLVCDFLRSLLLIPVVGEESFMLSSEGRVFVLVALVGDLSIFSKFLLFLAK